jgi:RNA polymerase sigma-70 factor (ECF subfamily)
MPDNVPDTEELLRRSARGDDQAMHLLFARHRGQLARMVSMRMDPRVRGRIDPSDVIQETLTLASQKLSQYMNDRPIPFYPWLRQIAWEKLVQEHNRHLWAAKRSVARETNHRLQLSDASAIGLAERLLGPSASPSSAAVRDELRQRVRRALDALTEPDREVLLLRYLEQMPSKEIAAVMGATEAAVNMRQMRALERMRKILNSQA